LWGFLSSRKVQRMFIQEINSARGGHRGFRKFVISEDLPRPRLLPGRRLFQNLPHPFPETVRGDTQAKCDKIKKIILGIEEEGPGKLHPAREAAVLEDDKTITEDPQPEMEGPPCGFGEILHKIEVVGVDHKAKKRGPCTIKTVSRKTD